MSKDKKKAAEPEKTEKTETTGKTAAAAEKTSAAPAPEAAPAAEKAPEKAAEKPAEPSELDKAKADLEKEHDSLLRLAAEYDNFRKRTQKEKDSLYGDAKAETVEKFLPVYDNLERALGQPTADDAYKKGVEMTMGGLLKVMEGLGVEPFGEKGEPFDPAMHNAVMHEDNPDLGENVLAEVFQKGFRIGGKVVRFAMVKVAN